MATLKEGLYDAYLLLLASQQSHISALMSVLNNRVNANDSKELLTNLVGKISEEFRLYFRSEEELMSVFLYDKISEKRNNHSLFLGKVKVFSDEYNKGTNTTPINQALNKWHKYFDNEIDDISEIFDNLETQLEETQDKFTEGNTLNVNVSIFDIQHRNIDFLLESIIHNLEYNVSKKETTALIEDLYNKFEIHFTHEEDLMQKHKFPEIEEHKKDHERFLALLKEYEGKYKDDELPASATSIFEIIKMEVDNHIINVDKKYSDFFNQLGII